MLSIYKNKLFVLDKDECSGDFCKNGGMCINSNGFYQCSCVFGWIGVNCINGKFYFIRVKEILYYFFVFFCNVK